MWTGNNVVDLALLYLIYAPLMLVFVGGPIAAGIQYLQGE